MSWVQSCVPEMQIIAPFLKFSLSLSRTLSLTIEGPPLKNNAELLVKTCASEILTITVGKKQYILQRAGDIRPGVLN